MEIKTGKSTYKLIKELGIPVNEEIEKDLLKLVKNASVGEKNFAKDIRVDTDGSSIQAALASVGCIALNLTEECNYRCSYCIYSGDYDYERSHGAKFMEYETAVKVIKFFFHLIMNDKRYTKNNHVTIAFYGGEPLVRFELLKKIVAAIEELAGHMGISEIFEIDLRINTNGYLLTDEITHFLKEKDFTIDVSIDGPETEHDKLRKTVDGKSTWQTVMKNLNVLYRKYPDYYNEKVKFTCVIHPLHDSLKIEKFFTSNEHLFKTDALRMGLVTLHNLKPQKRKKMDALSKNVAPEKVFNNLFLSEIFFTSIEPKLKLRYLDKMEHFTGTCFPGGAKMFVDSQGKFHICEKVNSALSIGDIDNGFDFEKIREIRQKYNREIIKNKCWECDIWPLCTTCYANTTKNEDFEFHCTENISTRLWLLKKYLIHMEKKSEKKNGSKTGNYDSISVADYLDGLQ